MGVLCIVAMLSFFTVPKFAAIQERVEVKHFITELSRVIEISQQKSREEKEQYGVLFTSEGYVRVDSELNFRSSLSPYPNKVDFRSSSFSNNVVLFVEDGSPSSSGNVSFLVGTDFKLIELEIQPATGRVKSTWE